MSKQYVLYTDGACQPNPGVGGWSFIFYDQDLSKQKVIRSGRVKDTTNNRMELLAVVNGLQYFLDEVIAGNGDTLHLFSDSKYLVQGISTWCDQWSKNSWKKKDNKPILNQDLWERIHKLKQKISIKCSHVKGHSGNHLNEMCDELAVKAIQHEA